MEARSSKRLDLTNGRARRRRRCWTGRDSCRIRKMETQTHDVCGEGRRAEQQQQQQQQAREAGKIWQLRTEPVNWGGAGAVPSRHGRELLVPPCHKLAKLHYSHSSDKHHHSQRGGRGGTQSIPSPIHSLLHTSTRMDLFLLPATRLACGLASAA